MPEELLFLLVSLSGAFGIGLVTAWFFGRSRREELRKDLERAVGRMDDHLLELGRLQEHVDKLNEQLRSSITRDQYEALQARYRDLVTGRHGGRMMELPAEDPESDQKLREELGLSLFSEVPPETHDDLSEIRGISTFIQERLNRIGIRTFSQLSSLNEVQVDMLNDAIEVLPGRIQREDWVGQCRMLVARR